MYKRTNEFEVGYQTRDYVIMKDYVTIIAHTTIILSIWEQF